MENHTWLICFSIDFPMVFPIDLPPSWQRIFRCGCPGLRTMACAFWLRSRGVSGGVTGAILALATAPVEKNCDKISRTCDIFADCMVIYFGYLMVFSWLFSGIKWLFSGIWWWFLWDYVVIERDLMRSNGHLMEFAGDLMDFNRIK